MGSLNLPWPKFVYRFLKLPSLPTASGHMLHFTPQQAGIEAKCRSGRPIHLTRRFVNNRHRPAMTLGCTGDWARCSGSQSYFLTEISIQIYSAATAAIPTVISQSQHRPSLVYHLSVPQSLYLTVSLVLICYFSSPNPALPFSFMQIESPK